MANSKNAISNKILISRFAPYFYKYKSILFIDLFCASLTTVCEMVFPLILRKITYTSMLGEVLTFNLLIKCTILYGVLKLIDIISHYYMARVGHIMGAKIETDMRRDVFNHLQKLSASYFNETKIGHIMSRITNDLFDVTEFAHHCPEEYFIGAIKIIVSFIILININVPLTLIIFAMIPLMVLSSTKFRNAMRKTFKRQRKHIGNLNANIEDSLLGINVVKSFTNEDQEIKKFEVGNLKFLSIKEESYMNMANFITVTKLFDGIMFLIVIFLGGLFIINGQIQSPDLIAYVLYVTSLLASIRRIIDFTEQFQKGMTGIERFIEIMDQDIEIFDEPETIDLIDIKGKVEFKNVSFNYEGYKKDVLKDLSLVVNPGENVALVGPSGSGKTTISSLIPRFYEVSSGNIYIDDKNIKDIKLKSLRSNIGTVQQDVYLFSGTVYENILYGRLDANEEEVIEASKLSGAYDFIMDLPDGFHTYVGERGIKLSGGQKQRISIARVFLKNPSILILDEATSALDNQSEKIIQTSLEKLATGRTTITIAHRLTTVKNADKIIVLTDKGIIEEGSYQELIDKKGYFYNLYTQSNGEIDILN